MGLQQFSKFEKANSKKRVNYSKITKKLSCPSQVQISPEPLKKWWKFPTDRFPASSALSLEYSPDAFLRALIPDDCLLRVLFLVSKYDRIWM
jgi:hypothetical protein